MLKSLRLCTRSNAARLTATLLLCGSCLLPAYASPFAAQEKEQKKQNDKEAQGKDAGKTQNPKESEKDKKKPEAAPQQPTLTPGEIIAEFVILAYGSRPQLEKSRASIQEEGTIRLASDQGDITGSYLMRFVRKEKTWQDLLRVDLELSTPVAAQRQGAIANVKYTVAYNGASIWSAQNGQYVNPTPEAEAAFRAQLSRDFTTLLRYKEDGSKLELKKPETVVGVECNVLEMTSPSGEKTTYWVSAKTYRILHLEYELKVGAEAKPIKYRISYFYTPVRVIQNTLVPARRVMYQDGKFVQEVTVNQFNYSAKFETEIFQHLP